MKRKTVKLNSGNSILLRLDKETHNDLRRLSNELTGIENRRVTIKEVTRRMKNIDGVNNALRIDAMRKRRIIK